MADGVRGTFGIRREMYRKSHIIKNGPKNTGVPFFEPPDGPKTPKMVLELDITISEVIDSGIFEIFIFSRFLGPKRPNFSQFLKNLLKLGLFGPENG